MGRGLAGSRAKEAPGKQDSTGVRRARAGGRESAPGGACVHAHVCMRECVHTKSCACVHPCRGQLYSFQRA